jgi:hypothetical protein
MSHTEETIWSQAVLELRRHGNEVTTFGVVSTINDLWKEAGQSGGRVNIRAPTNIVTHLRRGTLRMGKSLLVVVAVEDCAINLMSGH